MILEWFLKLFFSFLLSPWSVQPSLTLCTATKPQIAHFPHPVLFIHLRYNSGSALRSPLGVSNPFGTAWTKAKRGGGIGEWETCLMREMKMRVERPGIASRGSRLICCFQGEGRIYLPCLIISILRDPSVSLGRLLKDSVPEGALGKKGLKRHSPQIPIWSL